MCICLNSVLFFLLEVVFLVKFMFWIIRLIGCCFSRVNLVLGDSVCSVLMLCRENSIFSVVLMLVLLLMIRIEGMCYWGLVSGIKSIGVLG